MQSLVLGANPNVASAAVYIALDHGLFTAQHLAVKLVSTSGGSAAVPALVGGTYDITSTNDATAITARNKGVKIKFVANAISAKPDTYTLDVPPGSPIKSIKDLPGKTVGVSSLNDPPYLALRQEMTDYALDPNTVHWTQVAFADAGTYLKNHRVDAAVDTDPYRTQAKQQYGVVSVVPIFDTATGFADFPISAYVTTEKFANAHPDIIGAFQRAMLAADNLAANTQNVKTAILNHTKITKSVADLIDPPEFPADLDPKRLGRVVTMLQKATPPLLPPDFRIETMIIPMPTS